MASPANIFWLRFVSTIVIFWSWAATDAPACANTYSGARRDTFFSK